MLNRDVGLLLLRVALGLMMMTHGVGKVVNLFQGKTGFPDPLGIGGAPSLAFAAFAEFFCALAVVVGFKTRWASIPVVLTMAVAALIFHAGDPWGDRELAVLYGAGFLALVFTGAGRYSFDGGWGKRSP